MIKFKWTPASVRTWAKKPHKKSEIIKACIEHWEERMKAGKVDYKKETWWEVDYCPACQCFSDCYECVFSPHCSNGGWHKAGDELFDGTIGPACRAFVKWMKLELKEAAREEKKAHYGAVDTRIIQRKEARDYDCQCPICGMGYDTRGEAEVCCKRIVLHIPGQKAVRG